MQGLINTPQELIQALEGAKADVLASDGHRVRSIEAINQAIRMVETFYGKAQA